MMSTRKHFVSAIVAGSLAVALLPQGAAAQSMSPMRGKVQSFTDTFAVKVFPANPYGHRIRVEMRAYDAEFRPIENVKFSADNFTLASNASRTVTVLVPFDGVKEKRVRICTESVPFPGQSANNIKAQICGKFIGERR